LKTLPQNESNVIPTPDSMNYFSLWRYARVCFAKSGVTPFLWPGIQF